MAAPPILHLPDGTVVPDPAAPPPGPQGFYYTCTPCTAEPVTACAQVSSTTGSLELRFLVEVIDGSLPQPNGWAGTLSWSPGVAAAAPTVVFHPGGDGPNLAYGALTKEVESQGGRAVNLQWEDPDGTDGDTYVGWTTRPSAAPSSLRVMSRRPAAVFEWILANLAGGKPLGLVGCSRGSDAVFMARLWHGADAYARYMMLGGGPPSTNVFASCLKLAVYGRCTRAVRTCDPKSDPCGADEGTCDSWNLAPDKALDLYFHHMQAKMNHVHNVTSCGVAASEDFRKSSFVDNPEGAGDWSADYPIDFFLNYSAASSQGDDLFDVLVPGQEAFVRLSAPRKAIHLLPGSHCEAFGGAEARSALRAGMGWQ